MPKLLYKPRGKDFIFTCMKLPLFFVLFLSLSLCGYAQKDTLSPFPVKEGVYTTFRDIRDSNPLPIKDFKVIRRKNGTYKFKMDSLSKPKFDLFQKTLVGVSDGHDFYISGRFTNAGYLGIVKCYLKGPYIFAQEAPYNPAGLIGAIVTIGADYSGKGYVINVNKGLSLPLTKKFLKNLLRNYPDLDKEYKMKMSITDHSVEILERINERESIHN